MATDGSILVNIFNAELEPWSGPAVRLVLVNPFSQTSDKKKTFNLPKKTSRVRIADVKADAGERYALTAQADKHRDHVIFPVKPVAGEEVAYNVMLVPKNPAPNFSKFSYALLRQKSSTFHDALNAKVGEEEFRGLEGEKFGPERMASALNLEAKLRRTPLKDGDAVSFLKSVDGLGGIERDRIKCQVDPGMKASVRGLKTFSELNEDFNELNHKGYPVSFKEKVPFGSLQLSFAKKAGPEGLLAADIDIDLFTDIGHFGEVVKNKITKMKTDPYTVYVMLFDQGITPLYTLKP